MAFPAKQFGTWCGLDLSSPRVMGVLNITPDSFFDGGQLWADGTPDIPAALERARRMAAEGAAILDVGGESTRPGAAPPSEQEEMDRVLPVVEALHRELPTVISVDTSSPALMQEAAARGAGLINDVRALRLPGALEAAAATGLPVCLMHMQGEPGSMQDAPNYKDVVQEVRAFLAERVAACEAAGIPRERLLLDPGFGFGKKDIHNLALLQGLDSLGALGLPVLIGISRKSTIGRVLNRDVQERLAGGLALAVLALVRGASIVRTHDVRETADALGVAWACLSAAREPSALARSKEI